MLNNFYFLEDRQQEEGSLHGFLKFNPAHEIFKGHFPRNPIVPGVCTMAIVKEQLEQATSQKLRLKEAKAVKFLGLIDPTMSPKLTITWQEETEQINATATLHNGTIPLFKMSARYIPAI